MTLQLAVGPGAGAYASTLFTVTVNGSANYVYGKSRTTEFDVHPTASFWSVGQTVEVSVSRWGADVACTAVVTLIGSPISSAVVYPRCVYDDLTTITADGTLTVPMQPGTKVRCEINGQRGKRVIYLCCDTLTTVPVGGTVDTYNGTQVAALAGRTLLFPAGVHNLTTGTWGAKLFPIQNGASIYLSRDAWVIGTFNFATGASTNASDVTIYGPGNLSGEFTTNEAVDLLPEAERYAFSMFYTAATGAYSNNVLRDITVWQTPWYVIYGGLNEAHNTVMITPWNTNTDAIKLIGSGATPWVAQRNVVWNGDDCIALENWRRNGVVGGSGNENLLSTSAGSLLLFGYQTETFDLASFGFTTTVGNNYCVPTTHYELHAGGEEYGAVVQAWTDGARTTDLIGRFGVSFTGKLWVECPDDGDIRIPLFNIGNKAYPWGTPRDQYGQVSGWTIANVEMTKVPTVKSRIYGIDRTSAPNGLALENIATGGVRWSVRNLATFVTLGDETFNVTVDGRAA